MVKLKTVSLYEYKKISTLIYVENVTKINVMLAIFTSFVHPMLMLK